MWLKWAGLPPVVLGPSILSKRVETGPIATQFGPTCRKLYLVCQEHTYNVQNCFRWVTVGRYDNNKIK